LLSFFFQAEDGIRDATVTGVQTCALPILPGLARRGATHAARVGRRGGRESPVERAQLPPLPAREADRRQHARVPPHADTRQLRPTAAPLPAPGTESRWPAGVDQARRRACRAAGGRASVAAGPGGGHAPGVPG